MIGQDMLEAVQGYLDECLAETVYIEGAEGTLDRPAVIVRVDNFEPHEFIRSNYDCTLTVELETIPAETTRAAHLTLARQIEDALYNGTAMTATVAKKLYGLHDCWTTPAELSERDGLRVAEWTLRMVVVRGGEIDPPPGIDVFLAGDYLLPT